VLLSSYRHRARRALPFFPPRRSSDLIVAAFLAVATGGDGDGLRLGRWGDRWAGPASWVLGFLPVAAVIAIARLYRSRAVRRTVRSEEHTSELQSREKLVCRLLLEKKN